MRYIIALIVTYLFLSCSAQEKDIYLGHGIMAGEITSSSVILQSRLTASNKLIDGDLKGIKGVAKFELALDSTFQNSMTSDWIKAISEKDYIIKKQMNGLSPGKTYYYRLKFGHDKGDLRTSSVASFQTLYGPENEASISLAITACMNYYFFHYGKYNKTKAYSGEDKILGYPALEVIKKLKPTYFIGNGDNVYFDHPNNSHFQKALKKGHNPHLGDFDGKEVTNEAGMRKKYHQQFSQQRFHDVFKIAGTYWTKDDHDYRVNDADTVLNFPISHQLGIKNFKEQLPVTNPIETDKKNLSNASHHKRFTDMVFRRKRLSQSK